MDREEYVEFIKAQERNFRDRFGEELDKREFLFAARSAYGAQIEQFFKEQLLHLRGKRLKGLIDEMSAEIETRVYTDNPDAREFLERYREVPKDVNKKQKSGKRTSRANRPGAKLAAVPPRSNP